MAKLTFQMACQYFCSIMSPIINILDPPAKTGRPRNDLEKTFYTIIYKLKTGAQWKMITADESKICGTSANRVLNKWVKLGVFDVIFFFMANLYDKTLGFNITWQAIDGTKCQAPVRGEKLNTEGRGPNPTDRAFSGTKISLHVDKDGAPLGLVISGANVHDAKLLDETIRASYKTLYSIMGRRNKNLKMNLCLDRGYFGEPSELIGFVNGFHTHIRSRGEEVIDKKKDIENPEGGLSNGQSET